MKRAMKKRAKILFAAGVVCVLFLLASIGYAVTYNESRLVVPMDLSAYEFTIKDLPMIVSVTLVTVYVCAVVVVISVTDRKKLVTRRVDPRLAFWVFWAFWAFRVSRLALPRLCGSLFSDFLGFSLRARCQAFLWMSGMWKTERGRS